MKSYVQLHWMRKALGITAKVFFFSTGIHSSGAAYMKSQLSTASQRAFTPFQQFLLTLMQLRLNLSGQDLAYRSTVSRTFTYVIEVMCVRLKPFIFWPN